MDLTTSWVGIAALATFVLAYVAVIGEEFTHLRKSKPVMLGAGMIWAIIAFEDALLLECEENQIRAVFQEVIAGLENPYNEI